LFAGPEYCFYYKVAYTNLHVLICLLFGGALPLLYFIALLALSVQYFVDRLSLTYFYRIPPKFSDKLTKMTIKLMSFVPVLMLACTFWLHTNK